MSQCPVPGDASVAVYFTELGASTKLLYIMPGYWSVVLGCVAAFGLPNHFSM